MSDLQSLRNELRALDEHIFALEDQRRSLMLEGKRDPYTDDLVRGIDAQIHTVESRMSRLREIEAAAGKY